MTQKPLLPNTARQAELECHMYQQGMMGITFFGDMGELTPVDAKNLIDTDIKETDALVALFFGN